MRGSPRNGFNPARRAIPFAAARSVCLTGAVLLSLWAPERAHAYITPTPVNFVLQIVLGAAAVILLGVKIFWSRIRNLFKLKK